MTKMEIGGFVPTAAIRVSHKWIADSSQQNHVVQCRNSVGSVDSKLSINTAFVFVL